MPDRSATRRVMRRQRRELRPTQLARHATSVVHTLSNSPVYQCARHIALYVAVDGELAVEGIATRARRSGKSIYLPRVISATEMEFVAWAEDDTLAKSDLGLLEPRAGDLIGFADLDLVLVPSVAFDALGNRLGSGGGYYDRAFEFRRKSSQPILIGVGHSFQQVDTLIAADWDVPMDGVVSENGWIKELA